ncbi:HCP-like protein, partial [Hymenopellis radicata]
MYTATMQQPPRPTSQFTQKDQYPRNGGSQYDSVRSRASANGLNGANGYEREFGDGGDDERGYTPPQDQDTDPDDFYNGNGSHPPSTYMPDPYSQSRSVATQSIRAPSPPPAPILDHSHLRPGNQAALLSHERTLELYRANAKKTQDPDLQFEFAVFMIDASKSLPIPENTPEISYRPHQGGDRIAQTPCRSGHSPSQYFLADCYANGIGTVKNKQDFDRAYPLFVLAAKHGHADAAYRAGTCCENGWGCRRESAKALQFFRKAAASLHPGAMYRLGVAELNGELSLSKRPKEDAEHATAEFPHALHELALLHERGIDNVVFVDYEYSIELLAQAAELGYAASAYRLGECYDDPALSIHYYNIAAQQNHRDACFALTAWYLVGSPGVLPTAEAGLPKAMYAVGYFSEVGIGTTADMEKAVAWYKKATDLGDKRAAQRLKGSTNQPMHQPGGPGSVLHRGGPDDSGAPRARIR